MSYETAYCPNVCVACPGTVPPCEGGIQAISEAPPKYKNVSGRCVEDITHNTGQRRACIQPTKHAPHVWTPEPRRSQFCNCPWHSAALCAALSVSCSLFTILDYTKKTISHEKAMAQLDGHTMNGVRYPRYLGVTMTQSVHYGQGSER